MRWGVPSIRQVSFVCVGLGVAALLAADPWSSPAQASALASHRAIYDVRLADPDATSGFSQAGGRIVVEWQDVCSGYTFNSRSVTEFLSYTGDTVLSDRRYSSWESSNGETFRFSVENYVDENRAEGAAGTADRAKAAVKYEAPAESSLDLPDGVVFPTELSIEIINAAKRGDKIVRRALFEGTEDGTIFNSVAFIGRRQKPGSSKAAHGVKGGGDLSGLPYWPVTLSYFELAGQADLPVYEVSYHLYPNGISDHLKLNYGEFQLEASLSEIEFLKAPDCAG